MRTRLRSALLLCLPLVGCGDATASSQTDAASDAASTGAAATGDDATSDASPDATTGFAPTTGGAADTGSEPDASGGAGTGEALTGGAADTGAADTGIDTGADATTDATTGNAPVDTSTDLNGFAAWVHFTDPPSHADDNDRTILDEIIRLIDDTPPGAQILAAIHSLTVNEVHNALIAAHSRGVIVRVAEDGSDEFDDDASPLELAAALGEGHVFCGDGVEGGNYGCITTDPSGIMHTKLYTFSETRDPDGNPRTNVVWFGSANMTHATGAKTFNNTVTIYGDGELYTHFVAYFGQLFAQKHFAGNNFYDAEAGRGYFVTPTARVYASPDQDGDLVYNRLNDIVAGAGCQVRVTQAMMHDSRPALIDLLVKLKKGSCDVKIVGSSIQPESLAKIKAAKIPVRTNHVHDKTILVDAKFADSTEKRQLIFTGSHNWTYSANYRNDELFVRLESAALHAKYLAHFQRAWDTGTAP